LASITLIKNSIKIWLIIFELKFSILDQRNGCTCWGSVEFSNGFSFEIFKIFPHFFSILLKQSQNIQTQKLKLNWMKHDRRSNFVNLTRLNEFEKRELFTFFVLLFTFLSFHQLWRSWKKENERGLFRKTRKCTHRKIHQNFAILSRI
jgi:hypothetical protein